MEYIVFKWYDQVLKACGGDDFECEHAGIAENHLKEMLARSIATDKDVYSAPRD